MAGVIWVFDGFMYCLIKTNSMLIRVLLWFVAGYALHSMYVNSYLAIKGKAFGHFYWLAFYSICIIGSVLSYIYCLATPLSISQFISFQLTFLLLLLGLFSAVRFLAAETNQQNAIL